MAEATRETAPAVGRRYYGDLTLTEERRSRVVRIWQRARVPQGVIIAIAGTVLAIIWGWTPGYVAAFFALLAVLEAILWLRSQPDRPPVISIFIEISGVFISLAYVNANVAVLGIPWSYLTLAAFLLLPLRWAIPAVIYAGVGYMANARHWLPVDAPQLPEAQTVIAGTIVGILFTTAFLGLVSAVIAILNAESRRNRRRLAVDRALAQCSAALLGGGREDPENAALTALLTATQADSVFLERNVDDPHRGLCSSLERELLRPGIDSDEPGTWDLVPWSWSPDARKRLEAGWSNEVKVAELTGRLRELYDTTDIVSELSLPIFVNGIWSGVVGFSDTTGRRDWSRHDNTLLTTAAEMLGSFLERNQARHRIEATIQDLEEQRRYQTALADCSAALLTSDHDLALDAALDALLVATSADYAYVDVNYTDPTKRLCARIVHDAERVPTPVGRNEWWSGPYSELPTAYEDLRHGRPSIVTTAELSGRERQIYEDDGVKTELCLPIQVNGSWHGSMAFGTYLEDRLWTPGQVDALRTAANMIGSFWERRDARRTLERLVTSLDTNLTYEKALANCSRALLTSDAESAVDVALRELLSATNAPKVFVDVNDHDPELGLCARMVHEAIKPGFEHIVTEELRIDEAGGEPTSAMTPYDWVPRMRDTLAGGQPVVIDTARLSEQERRIYANDNCLTELNIPIFSAGRWVGTLGFTEYETRRVWNPDEIAMLHTAAEMIGAFWERQASRHRLEELVRAKDEFVATVSHELRTPLTAVVGLSDELQHRRPDFDESELTEFVALIAEQSNEVAGIVEDLLTAARTSVGTLVVTCEAVDVRIEVDAVLAGLETNRGGAFEVVGASPAVWADPSRFRQIVRNLVTNARRHGGENVRIELLQRAGRSVVAVLDDGDGIPDALREQVFEPYARAHEAGTQPASVGLGLSVARELARLMGGDVCHGREAGWTRFELLLPLAADIVVWPKAGVAAG
jgi:signal transduction histidine kinase